MALQVSTARPQETLTRVEECIDVFCHFLPLKYCRAVRERSAQSLQMFERAQQIQPMVNLDARLQVLREFDGYHQIISLSSPPVEVLAPEHSVELSRLANDELALACQQGGQRFCGFAAALPLNDVEASVAEAKRAIEQLGALAIQVFTSVQGRPLDAPDFLPLFQLMAELDRPILLHPSRSLAMADYPSEQYSKCDLWWALGWPHETTVALTRLALAGIFHHFPNLKIVAHHVGGYLPMMGGRLGPGMELLGSRTPPEVPELANHGLQEPLLEACRRFYVDTASFGWAPAIECGRAFFGAERMLFASDMPFDPGQGPDYIRSTLAAIRSLELPEDQQRAILSENARNLFLL